MLKEAALNYNIDIMDSFREECMQFDVDEKTGNALNKISEAILTMDYDVVCEQADIILND
ncbi:MAG: hypothetical protein Pg6A_06010 [Termitinemataceae bacterium]|nr:MAG: hypothetical protein Pg6A_06010 [Termitinemataceae bacterium]